MKLWARKNHVGWIHVWTRADGFANGEPSDHFFNSRTDALWRDVALPEDSLEALDRGELVELEDPGYFEADGSS